MDDGTKQFINHLAEQSAADSHSEGTLVTPAPVQQQQQQQQVPEAPPTGEVKPVEIQAEATPQQPDPVAAMQQQITTLTNMLGYVTGQMQAIQQPQTVPQTPQAPLFKPEELAPIPEPDLEAIPPELEAELDELYQESPARANAKYLQWRERTVTEYQRAVQEQDQKVRLVRQQELDQGFQRGYLETCQAHGKDVVDTTFPKIQEVFNQNPELYGLPSDSAFKMVFGLLKGQTSTTTPVTPIPASTPAALLKDVNTKAELAALLKDEIIRDYLQTVQQRNRAEPMTIAGQAGGVTVMAPPNAPQSLSEATAMWRRDHGA